MEFNELIAELRASSENLPNESADRSLLSSVYCNKACKAIDKIAESQEYDNVITGLWLIVAHFAEQLRYLKPVPALSELCFKLFRQCSKSVLNIQWQNLEEDSSVRQNFLVSLANLHAKLIPFDFPRFRLLEALTESPWTNPTLAKVMGGEIEDADKEEVRSYIEQEDPIILQLRVDMMLKENCEEYALNLCNSCLTHPELQTDFSIRKIQLSLLYKLGHEDKLQEECQKLNINDALRIIKQLQTSEPHRQLCTVLAQTFMVQNWIRPTDMEANKELLRLWIRQQLLVDREQDQFKESVWAMAKLSQSTEQIVIFIDVLREECGDTYLQLYVDMCIFAINVDKGQMETSIKEDNLVAAVARRGDMASVCAKLSCLCHHTSLKVARICALTSFALKPSDQSLAKIGTFYGQGGGCCKKCGVGNNHDPGKVNPATLYEVERLLNMLRPEYLNPDNNFVNIQALCRRFLHESLKVAEERKQESAVAAMTISGPEGKKKMISSNKATNLFEALLPQDVQNTQSLLNKMRLQNIPTIHSPPQTTHITYSAAGVNRHNILTHHSKQQYAFDSEKVKNSLPYGIPMEQQHQYYLSKHEKELEQRRKNSMKKKEGKAQEPLASSTHPQQHQNARQDSNKQGVPLQQLQTCRSNSNKQSPQQQQQVPSIQVSQLIHSALRNDPAALQKLSQTASPEMVRAVIDILKNSAIRPAQQQQKQLGNPIIQGTGPSQPLPTVSTLLKPTAQQPQQLSEAKREQPPPRRYPRPQLYAQPIVVSSSSGISSSLRPQLSNVSISVTKSYNFMPSSSNVTSTMTVAQKQKSDLASKSQAESIRQLMHMQMTSNLQQKQISEMRQMSGSTITVNNISSSNNLGSTIALRPKTTVELAEKAALAKQQGKSPAYQPVQSQGFPSSSNPSVNKTNQQFMTLQTSESQSQLQKQQSQNSCGLNSNNFNTSSSNNNQNLTLSDELSGSIMGIDDTIIKELLQDSGILANTFPDIEVDTIGEDKSRKISELVSLSQLNVPSVHTFDFNRRTNSNISAAESFQTPSILSRHTIQKSGQPAIQTSPIHIHTTSQLHIPYSQPSLYTGKSEILTSSNLPVMTSKVSLPCTAANDVNSSLQSPFQVSSQKQFTVSKLSLQPRENMSTSVTMNVEETKPTMDQLREQMKKEDIQGEIYLDSANNATYRCIICSQAFETLDNLREHVRNVCKPGLQSSSVYTSKIKQDKANSAKAGLETTTVFQCLRCFELCVSDAGIKQHRLTCKRVPTVPSDIKKEVQNKARSAIKSGRSTPKREIKDSSYIVPEMPLPFPYPSLNSEAVKKSLALAGKSSMTCQERALTSKQQVSSAQATGAPLNSITTKQQISSAETTESSLNSITSKQKVSTAQASVAPYSNVTSKQSMSTAQFTGAPFSSFSPKQQVSTAQASGAPLNSITTKQQVSTSQSTWAPLNSIMSKQQVSTAQTSRSPINIITPKEHASTLQAGTASIQNSRMLSINSEQLFSIGRAESSKSGSVYSANVSNITSSVVTTVARSANLMNVSNSLNTSTLSRVSLSYTNPVLTTNLNSINNVINEAAKACYNLLASDSVNDISITRPVTHGSAFVEKTPPSVNNSSLSQSTCNATSSNLVQPFQNVSAQYSPKSSTLGSSQMASPIAPVIEAEKVIPSPVLPKKAPKRAKQLPAPCFTEISGSGGSKFYKCDLCSQTLCSVESFGLHWEECVSKNKALLKRRASREKLLNVKPPTEEMVKKWIDVIAFVAAGGGAADSVFDNEDLSETELVLLEDPCEIHANQSELNYIVPSESDADDLNSLISTKSDEDNISEATTEKDSEEDVAYRKARSRCQNSHKDSARHDNENLGRSSKMHARSRNGEKELEDTEGDKTSSSSSEFESEGSGLSCQLCKTSYHNKRMLIQHYAGRHLKPYTVKRASDNTSYICHLCQKSFPIFMHYMQHVPDHSVTIYEKMKAFIIKKRLSHRNKVSSLKGMIHKKNAMSLLAKSLKSKRAAKMSALDRIKREILSSNTEAVREKLSLSKKKKSKSYPSSEEDYTPEVHHLKRISEIVSDVSNRRCGRQRKPASYDETSSSERSGSKLSSNRDEDYVLSDDTEFDYRAPITTRSKKYSLNRKEQWSGSDTDNTSGSVMSKHPNYIKSMEVSGFDSDSNSATLTFLQEPNGTLIVLPDQQPSNLDKSDQSSPTCTITVRSLNKKLKETLKLCDLRPTIVLKNLTTKDIEKSTGDIKLSNLGVSAQNAVPASSSKTSSFFDSFLSYLNQYPASSEEKNLPSESVVPKSNSSNASTELCSSMDTDGSTVSYGTNTDKEDYADTTPLNCGNNQSDVQTLLAKFPTRRCSVNLGKKLDPILLSNKADDIVTPEDDVKLPLLVDVKVCLPKIETPGKYLKQDTVLPGDGKTKVEQKDYKFSLVDNQSKEIISTSKGEALSEACIDLGVGRDDNLSLKNMNTSESIDLCSSQTLDARISHKEQKNIVAEKSLRCYPESGQHLTAIETSDKKTSLDKSVSNQDQENIVMKDRVLCPDASEVIEQCVENSVCMSAENNLNSHNIAFISKQILLDTIVCENDQKSIVVEESCEVIDPFVESGVILSVENIDTSDSMVCSKESLLDLSISQEDQINVSEEHSGDDTYELDQVVSPKELDISPDKKDGIIIIETNSDDGHDNPCYILEENDESEDFYIIKETSDPEMDETELIANEPNLEKSTTKSCTSLLENSVIQVENAPQFELSNSLEQKHDSIDNNSGITPVQQIQSCSQQETLDACCKVECDEEKFSVLEAHPVALDITSESLTLENMHASVDKSNREIQGQQIFLKHVSALESSVDSGVMSTEMTLKQRALGNAIEMNNTVNNMKDSDCHNQELQIEKANIKLNSEISDNRTLLNTQFQPNLPERNSDSDNVGNDFSNMKDSFVSKKHVNRVENLTEISHTSELSNATENIVTNGDLSCSVNQCLLECEHDHGEKTNLKMIESGLEKKNLDSSNGDSVNKSLLPHVTSDLPETSVHMQLSYTGETIIETIETNSLKNSCSDAHIITLAGLAQNVNSCNESTLIVDTEKLQNENFQSEKVEMTINNSAQGYQEILDSEDMSGQKSDSIPNSAEKFEVGLCNGSESIIEQCQQNDAILDCENISSGLFNETVNPHSKASLDISGHQSDSLLVSKNIAGDTSNEALTAAEKQYENSLDKISCLQNQTNLLCETSHQDFSLPQAKDNIDLPAQEKLSLNIPVDVNYVSDMPENMDLGKILDVSVTSLLISSTSSSYKAEATSKVEYKELTRAKTGLRKRSRNKDKNRVKNPQVSLAAFVAKRLLSNSNDDNASTSNAESTSEEDSDNDLSDNSKHSLVSHQDCLLNTKSMYSVSNTEISETGASNNLVLPISQLNDIDNVTYQKFANVADTSTKQINLGSGLVDYSSSDEDKELDDGVIMSDQNQKTEHTSLCLEISSLESSIEIINTIQNVPTLDSSIPISDSIDLVAGENLREVEEKNKILAREKVEENNEILVTEKVEEMNEILAREKVEENNEILAREKVEEMNEILAREKVEENNEILAREKVEENNEILAREKVEENNEILAREKVEENNEILAREKCEENNEILAREKVEENNEILAREKVRELEDQVAVTDSNENDNFQYEISLEKEKDQLMLSEMDKYKYKIRVQEKDEKLILPESDKSNQINLQESNFKVATDKYKATLLETEEKLMPSCPCVSYSSSPEYNVSEHSVVESEHSVVERDEHSCHFSHTFDQKGANATIPEMNKPTIDDVSVSFLDALLNNPKECGKNSEASCIIENTVSSQPIHIDAPTPTEENKSEDGLLVNVLKIAHLKEAKDDADKNLKPLTCVARHDNVSNCYPDMDEVNLLSPFYPCTDSTETSDQSTKKLNSLNEDRKCLQDRNLDQIEFVSPHHSAVIKEHIQFDTGHVLNFAVSSSHMPEEQIKNTQLEANVLSVTKENIITEIDCHSNSSNTFSGGQDSVQAFLGSLPETVLCKNAFKTDSDKDTSSVKESSDSVLSSAKDVMATEIDVKRKPHSKAQNSEENEVIVNKSTTSYGVTNIQETDDKASGSDIDDDLSDFDLVIEEDTSSRNIVPYKVTSERKSSQAYVARHYSSVFADPKKEQTNPFINTLKSIKEQLQKQEHLNPELSPRRPLSGAKSLKKVSQEQFVWDVDDDEESKHNKSTFVKTDRTKVCTAAQEAIKRKRNALKEKTEKSPFTWDLDDGNSEKTTHIVNQENKNALAESQSDLTSRIKARRIFRKKKSFSPDFVSSAMMPSKLKSCTNVPAKRATLEKKVDMKAEGEMLVLEESPLGILESCSNSITVDEEISFKRDSFSSPLLGTSSCSASSSVASSPSNPKPRGRRSKQHTPNVSVSYNAKVPSLLEQVSPKAVLALRTRHSSVDSNRSDSSQTCKRQGENTVQSNSKKIKKSSDPLKAGLIKITSPPIGQTTQDGLAPLTRSSEAAMKAFNQISLRNRGVDALRVYSLSSPSRNLTNQTSHKNLPDSNIKLSNISRLSSAKGALESVKKTKVPSDSSTPEKAVVKRRNPSAPPIPSRKPRLKAGALAKNNGPVTPSTAVFLVDPAPIIQPARGGSKSSAHNSTTGTKTIHTQLPPGASVKSQSGRKHKLRLDTNIKKDIVKRPRKKT
ncbi:uncharacterized protein LOC106054163 [Biomphalaria glabrata]|uniref:Uncharacterized protein LOC106054163 n=1 Tax=Biomphalaria glabrata TaxID=6526 RepID=A0A9W3A8V0_BIOGL|nr:uncharacterized protein LOC106054163 [Biomphalaria glabrata]